MNPIDPEPRHLIAVPRGESEEVRVTLSKFKGKLLCDVRIWRHRDGAWIPERRGISLRREELLAVADGLRAGMVALQEQTRDSRGEERASRDEPVTPLRDAQRGLNL